MYRVIYVLFLQFFCCLAPLESIPQLKTLDVCCAISRKDERTLERQYGLVSHGNGWTRRDGMIVPRFHLFCHRPMELEEARQLYSNLLSKLSQRVAMHLQTRVKSPPNYQRVPVELLLSYVPPTYDRKFAPCYVTMISNGKELVRYDSYDKARGGYFTIYREPEWNLVQWSDQYKPDIDPALVKDGD